MKLPWRTVAATRGGGRMERIRRYLVLASALLLPLHSMAESPRDEAGLAEITALAARAYVWGLGPEYVERFSTYNTIIGAPFNALTYGAIPAAWNNAATNAGNASVLYVSGFVDFNREPELVLTVPPSSRQYYVVAYMDAFANTVGSVGTRTTPSDALTSYLLVGPDSPHARQKTARIHGYDYPVMASDTNVNWLLIRIRVNTLVDAADPTSVRRVDSAVVQKFALNTLSEFEHNDYQPVYPSSYVLPPLTQAQIDEAKPFRDTPTSAVDFLSQLGSALVKNPLPGRRTGLSGTRLEDLPPWVVPQYGARGVYVVPSYGQQDTLDTFAPIGLTAKGFRLPHGWGARELAALQSGYELGQRTLEDFIAHRATSPSTNYWTIVNGMVGTYPNTTLGYLYRSLVVVEGGVANIAVDAIYPTLLGNPGPFDGNRTFALTFMPRPASVLLPADGIYPPIVSDANGKAKGFWSITLYATDPSEAAAPFLSQTSVLNTHYSSTDTAVLSVDATGNTLTVRPPAWGTLTTSAPVLFGDNAAAYGLVPGAVYYVANSPQANVDGTAYTLTVSAQWLQDLSEEGVPIQYSGHPGETVDLQSPAGAGALTYGMVKPVSQLGSVQLDAGQLATNADGSLTLWFAPALPTGAPASNWIPTPSTAYYGDLYPGMQIGTAFEVMLRMYYPTPGEEPPSILPCMKVCRPRLHESYIPPQLQQID